MVTIAIVGTRNAQSNHIAAVQSIARAAKKAGHSIVTGCCRGIDSATKQAAASAGVPCRVITSINQTPQALRTRTAHVISAASIVYVIPSNNRLQHSGSWLAVSLAVKAGNKAIFVMQPSTTAALPTWATVPAWRIIKSKANTWVQPVIAQQSLFGQSCPECNNQIINQSGCQSCPSCGWSACG